jgi:hypothetical protein
VKPFSRSSTLSKRSTRSSRKLAVTWEVQADCVVVSTQMRNTAYRQSEAMSLSHLRKWAGALPFALSLPCTLTPLARSTLTNSPCDYGAISTTTPKRGNSPEKQPTSMPSVLSSISFWNRYTSYIPRSVPYLYQSHVTWLTFKVLSEDSDKLKETLADLRITLKASAYKMDVRPLLKVVLEAFFGPSVGLVDMITQFVPSPQENAELKVSLDICSGCLS